MSRSQTPPATPLGAPIMPPERAVREVTGQPPVNAGGPERLGRRNSTPLPPQHDGVQYLGSVPIIFSGQLALMQPSLLEGFEPARPDLTDGLPITVNFTISSPTERRGVSSTQGISVEGRLGENGNFVIDAGSLGNIPPGTVVRATGLSFTHDGMTHAVPIETSNELTFNVPDRLNREAGAPLPLGNLSAVIPSVRYTPLNANDTTLNPLGALLDGDGLQIWSRNDDNSVTFHRIDFTDVPQVQDARGNRVNLPSGPLANAQVTATSNRGLVHQIELTDTAGNTFIMNLPGGARLSRSDITIPPPERPARE